MARLLEKIGRFVFVMLVFSFRRILWGWNLIWLFLALRDPPRPGPMGEGPMLSGEVLAGKAARERAKAGWGGD